MAAREVFPADLCHLIANELGERSDFATLYNCVISSRYFGACGAVSALYRYHYPILQVLGPISKTTVLNAVPGYVMPSQPRTKGLMFLWPIKI
jgi:hypothetical protein